MKVTFKPAHVHGIVRGIASKSYLHRLLLGAALSKGETVIENVDMSKDIYATISAVSGLGRGVEVGDHTLRVYDAAPEKTVNVNESGSTFRFMLPVAAAFDKKDAITITGSDYLASRPISPLYEELTAHGAVISEKGKFPMTVDGKLKGGIYRIPGNISSQFVSGLLLALPLCGEDSEIVIDGRLESKPYVDITIECLSVYGIKIIETEIGYTIPGNQTYTTPGRVRCEADYSNAAFFLAAGALSFDPVGVSGLRCDTAQGDAECVSILKKFGAVLTKTEDTIEFRCSPLSATDIDATDIPDLIPILSLVASVSEGTTVISGARRLRFKESDRLKSVSTVLSALGANITETEDGLIIKGVPELCGGEVSSYNDHRIAMTVAVASLVSGGSITVDGFEAVNKSYPHFLDDFASVGGKFTVID